MTDLPHTNLCQRWTIIWSRKSYDTKLLCLFWSLSHGHDIVFPLSVLLHTFYTTMCTSWEFSDKNDSLPQDDNTQQQTQPWVSAPPSTSNQPPFASNLPEYRCVSHPQQEGINDRLAYFLSEFKTIFSFHLFRIKWLCSTVFSSDITNFVVGLYYPVDTVDLNRAVIKAKEYIKATEEEKNKTGIFT